MVSLLSHNIAQKMKFSIKDFFSKYYQIRSFLVSPVSNFLCSANRKGCWYPPTESCIAYIELLFALPKKAASVYIAVSTEEKLRTWVDRYTLAVCQQTVL